MDKKCLICEDPGEYMIKDSTDFYCKACALDYFADLEMLCKIEATNLKKFLDDKIVLDDNGQVVVKE